MTSPDNAPNRERHFHMRSDGSTYGQGLCERCRRCAGCHADTGGCPVPNTSCVIGRWDCGMTDQPQETAARSAEAIERAANNLFVILSHESEDALEDAYANTWLGGTDDWFEHGWEDATAPKHRERVFCLVLEDLARQCIERAAHDEGTPIPACWLDPPNPVHSCYDEMPSPLTREDWQRRWRCSCGKVYRVQDSQRDGFHFAAVTDV